MIYLRGFSVVREQYIVEYEIPIIRELSENAFNYVLTLFAACVGRIPYYNRDVCRDSDNGKSDNDNCNG